MRHQLKTALAVVASASAQAASAGGSIAAPCELECSLSGNPQALRGGVYRLTGTATNNCSEPLSIDKAILRIDGPGQRRQNVLWGGPQVILPGVTRTLHVSKMVALLAPLGEYTVSMIAMRSGEPVASDTMLVEVVPTLVPSMVLVPSGTFIMGDGVAHCGVDEREVTLTRDFWLGQYEVTNQEYRAWVQWAYDRGYVTATSTTIQDNLGSTEELVDLDDPDCEIAFSGGVFSLREAGDALRYAYPEGYNPAFHPVTCVSWYGSVAYCDWLSLSEGLNRAYDHSTWTCGGGDPYSAEGYRLPTDAEWEYAAQWNDERIYPWGDGSPTCSQANFYPYPRDSCVGWTSPVGSYPAGAQPNLSDPIYDLSGNVHEFVNDWWRCGLGAFPLTDPPGPESSHSRVGRGGGWGSNASNVRAASRPAYAPHFHYRYLGFRLARSD